MGEHSAPAYVSLKPSQFGITSVWKFEASRQVGSLAALGVDEQFAKDTHGEPLKFENNQICSTQGDEEEKFGQQASSCCLYKNVAAATPPEQCPQPVTPTCALLLQRK